MDIKDIGENLRKLRRINRLSQQELADKVGISRLAYSQIERGEVEAKVSTLTNLAKVLDVKLQDLFIKPRRLTRVRWN